VLGCRGFTHMLVGSCLCIEPVALRPLEVVDPGDGPDGRQGAGRGGGQQHQP
jgi:hypothetical protein